MQMLNVLSGFPIQKFGSHTPKATHVLTETLRLAKRIAGADILRKGGNAVDAAVAASFAISVTRPQSTGIGGGGFLLLYLAKEKKTLAFDFRERAPLKADRDMFIRDGEAVPSLSRTGPLAVGVPGLVAGLVEVHQKYGSLPLKEVMAPAIRLADEGFPVYSFLAKAFGYREEMLGKSPATRAIYFRDEKILSEGELLYFWCTSTKPFRR